MYRAGVLTTLFIIIISFLTSCHEDLEIKESNNVTQNTTEPKASTSKIANHDYWYFFRGNSSANLRYSYSNDGINWLGNVAFNNGAKSNTGPAAIYFNGKFIVVYRGENTTNVFYSYSYDGLSWYGNTQIPGIQTSASPSLVVWNGQVYLFYSGDGVNANVWYVKSSDGINWSSQVNTGSFSTGAVAAAVDSTKNYLYFLSFYKDATPPWSSALYYRFATASDTNGNPVFGQTQYIKDCIGSTIPVQVCGSMAFLNGKMHIAYGEYSGAHKLRVAVEMPGFCQGWNFYDILTAETLNRPSIINLNGKLTVVYKGDESNNIFYSYSYDGINWHGNTRATGDTYHGGPYLIGD